MSSELHSPCRRSSLTTCARPSPENQHTPSQTSLLLIDAQHSFDPRHRRHLVSRFPTRCQGRLLGRQVRLSTQSHYTWPPHSAHLYPPTSTSFPPPLNDLRNGDQTCDGLSSLARALIGLAFCTYHPINPQPTFIHLH